MAHTNTWSTTIPTNDQLAGKGAEELVKVKTDIKERLTLDHYMDGEIDDTQADAEGRHRKVTLTVLTSDPTAITNAGIVYAKSDGIYFRNSTGVTKLI
jgi:hypothetical protein